MWVLGSYVVKDHEARYEKIPILKCLEKIVLGWSSALQCLKSVNNF